MSMSDHCVRLSVTQRDIWSKEGTWPSVRQEDDMVCVTAAISAFVSRAALGWSMNVVKQIRYPQNSQK